MTVAPTQLHDEQHARHYPTAYRDALARVDALQYGGTEALLNGDPGQCTRCLLEAFSALHHEAVRRVNAVQEATSAALHQWCRSSLKPPA